MRWGIGGGGDERGRRWRQSRWKSFLEEDYGYPLPSLRLVSAKALNNRPRSRSRSLLRLANLLGPEVCSIHMVVRRVAR